MKLDAGTMKWQAAPGWLFCKKIAYEPNRGSIILPGAKTKENVYQVMSVGPDVLGYKVGDIVAMAKGAECQAGVFISAKDVIGRLVPNDAPDSAVATFPPSVTEPAPAPTPIPPSVDGEALARDMAAAD